MKKQFNKIQADSNVMEEYYKKYRNIMIIFCSIIVLIAISLCVYWNYDPYNINDTIDNLYLTCHILNASFTAIMILILVLDKFNKIHKNVLLISVHLYSLLFILVSCLTSILDLSIGLSPISFFLICAFIGGIFIIKPYYFLSISVICSIIILVFATVRKYTYFENLNRVENYIYFISFVVIIVLVNLRQFTVIKREHCINKKLEKLTYYDELTGLLNERSYLEEIDKMEKEISTGKNEPFAIVVLDVNNLKATNDTYGHHFGCSLIVRCGHILPEIFISSKCFHFGGDEFFVIVKGKDYQNFDERIKTMEERLYYSKYEFEETELIFSVAFGYAHHQENFNYNDVFQNADNAMYENKKMLKEKYNFKSR